MEGGIGDDGIGDDGTPDHSIIGDGGTGDRGAEGDPAGDDRAEGDRAEDDGAEDHRIGDLVRAAADHDQAAWEQLVQRFGGLLWAIARAYGLFEGDAADVTQITWLRLVEHIRDIREPDRVGAWLAQTCRRECLRLLRQSGRQVPLGNLSDLADMELTGGWIRELGVDARLLAEERHAAFWKAVGLLPARCAALLRILAAEPPPSYEEVSAALGRPIGAIGPTRARCLEQLRKKLEEWGINGGDGAS